MNLRLTNLVVIIFITTKCISQEKSVFISGKISSSSSIVGNVHIINLSNRLGTISNNIGEFQIKVTTNDTLMVSSIQYEKIKIVITEKQLKSKTINIYLKPVITALEEVFLRGLTGNLNLDIKSVPKDTLPKHNLIYKLSDLDKVLPPDTKGPKKAPFVGPFKPLPAVATFPDYYMIKIRKLKRELQSKKAFPKKIKRELGIGFFTEELNIPKEKINHFLAYCEYKNIIEEYNKNNLLNVIKILLDESKNYHKIEK